jgi:hypothetical protein
MKSSRLALVALATIVAIGSLAASGHYAPAAAGGLGPNYGWMGNQKYMECLKYVGALSGNDYPGRDNNIRACKKNYIPGGQ